MAVETIVDAGPLVGWFNGADQWHDWSVRTLTRRRGPLHTTEIVLGEACYHLGGDTAAVHSLLNLVRQGGVRLHALWPEHLRRTQELMVKFHERMDAADASLVVLSELYPEATVATVDAKDFQLYRRFAREPIPLLIPGKD
jgi:predicted nucleic acid-binding protein